MSVKSKPYPDFFAFAPGVAFRVPVLNWSFGSHLFCLTCVKTKQIQGWWI